MISVIIPFYRSEDWIKRCADSLHALEGDFQFIFIDDNCPEGIETDMLHEYDDPRFIIERNMFYPGASGARNTGLDAATGEWITFLDADDEMLPDAADTFKRMIKLDPTANIIQANHLRKYIFGEPINKYANESGIYQISNLPACWCMVWNKLYRSSLIGNIRFDEDLQFGEDEMFNMECLAKDGRIFHTKHDTVTILRHFDNKESLSHIKNKHDLLKQARAIEDFIMRNKDPDVRRMAYDRLVWHWQSSTYRKAFGVRICDI